MAFEVEFSKRLDLFGAEIFAALNDKKVALEAQGKKLYNLSVGTPDFEPMPHIKQALCDAAMVSENWKYSLRDLPELLDTVCAYYKRRFDVTRATPCCCPLPATRCSLPASSWAAACRTTTT